MKTGMHAWLARVALLLVAIAAWGTGAGAQSLSGKYGGDECPYELTFAGKGVVYITTLGMTDVRGQYKVDGDKVLVSASGWPGAVFTRKGNTLETAFMGETLVCTKLSAAGSTRPQVTPAPAAAARMSSADRAAMDFIRASIDSHWVKGPDGWTTQPQDSNPLYTQFQELTFTVKPRQVSEAQRLNGADYRGTVTFKPTPERSYHTSPQGWSDWGDGDPGTLGVERRNGEWRVWRVIGSPDVLELTMETNLFKGLKPDPARVPTGHDTLATAPPASGEGAESCEHYGPAYNQDNLCFDTRPVPLSTTRIPVPADAPIFPQPAVLLFHLSRSGETIEAHVIVHSNLDTFNDQALDLAKRLRWNPAQKNGEAVEAWVPWQFQPTRDRSSAAVAGARSGFITVNVSGRTGEVYIDNAAVGGTPLFNYRVGAGRHTIRVRAGYRTWEETVQVDSGTTVVKSYDATGR